MSETVRWVATRHRRCKMENNPHRYDDIINLPHHVSETRPRMSPINRAAQFSPFAALTGYDAQIEEAARLTDGEVELSEDEKAKISDTLREIENALPQRPAVTVTYFLPDSRKAGGSYTLFSGTVKKIDLYERRLVFYGENGISSGTCIPIDDIIALQIVK